MEHSCTNIVFINNKTWDNSPARGQTSPLPALGPCANVLIVDEDTPLLSPLPTASLSEGEFLPGTHPACYF